MHLNPYKKLNKNGINCTQSKLKLCILKIVFFYMLFFLKTPYDLLQASMLGPHYARPYNDAYYHLVVDKNLKCNDNLYHLPRGTFFTYFVFKQKKKKFQQMF